MFNPQCSRNISNILTSCQSKSQSQLFKKKRHSLWAKANSETQLFHVTRAFPPPGAEQVTWQCGGESEESGFFGGFLDEGEAGIEVHPGQTNGGYRSNSINMEGKKIIRILKI